MISDEWVKKDSVAQAKWELGMYRAMARDGKSFCRDDYERFGFLLDMEGKGWPVEQLESWADEMPERTENPAWQEYTLRYNVLYHDYHYSDAELEALMGPEPDRWLYEAEEDYRRTVESFLAGTRS